MRTLLGPMRDRTWVLGVAILSLGVSLWLGRSQGHVVEFVSGFFLGLSLALSVFYMVAHIIRPAHGGSTPLP